MTEFNEESKASGARSPGESPNTQSQTGRDCWARPTLKRHTTMDTDKVFATKEGVLSAATGVGPS